MVKRKLDVVEYAVCNISVVVVLGSTSDEIAVEVKDSVAEVGDLAMEDSVSDDSLCLVEHCVIGQVDTTGQHVLEP